MAGLLKEGVRVEWDHRQTQAELTHQLEPGEKPPVVKRRGIILQFLWTMEMLRGGTAADAKCQAVILDDDIAQICMKPLNELRVVRPKVVAPANQEGPA